MNHATHKRPHHRRPYRRGAAMVEFLLMIPIIVFVISIGCYMAIGMRCKQDTLVRSRYDLWLNINQWWHDWDEEVTHWSAWDTGANGSIPSPVNEGNRPRGTGEALEHLYDEAGREAYETSSNMETQDYFRRIWNNLPGRHVVRRTRTLETSEAVSFLESDVHGRHIMDSSTWPVAHLRLWYFAQYGPMKEINDIFHDELDDMPDEYKRVREEILHNWFSEAWMPNWNSEYAVFPD
ncbi:MAG: hypothetical protein JXL80_14355 [Planctomycetes bacterium]|nr:hypothetical protein [Planctomycetota bacterium]